MAAFFVANTCVPVMGLSLVSPETFGINHWDEEYHDK